MCKSMKVRKHSLYRKWEVINVTEAQPGMGKTEGHANFNYDQLQPGH